MGQCGCSETSPEVRLPGPEGVHYGIEIYPGCRDCHTPVGVIVHRFDDKWAEDWLDFGGVPEAEFQTYEGINGVFVLPVLEAKNLAAELTEYREDSGYDDIREQEIQASLPQAVWQTLSDWHEIARKVAEHIGEER